MRISRIRVANHRSIPDLDVQIRRHLVLVGPNECGKTSLLALLDSVVSGSLAQLYSTLVASSFRDLALPLMVEVEFYDFTELDQAAFADHILVPADPQQESTLTLRLTAQVAPDSEEVAIERGFVKPGLPVKASYDLLQAIGWAFLPATRSPDRELGSSQRSAIRTLLAGIDLGESEEGVREAVEALHAVIDGAESVGSLRGEIATALGALLPRPLQHDDVVLRLPNADEVDPLADVDVHLRDTEGGNRALRLQSDGVRAMSTVAVQLLTKGSAAIIAVDEPEIHLHPRAQAQLARRLNDAAGQRIVATHSPAVLERFSPLDVVALAPGDVSRQLSVHPFADEPKLAEHWWTTATLEPVTSRSTILVEGIADRVLIEAVAAAIGHDLDRLGVSVVEVDGAGNFGAAIRLFGREGFGIPLSGLVDKKEASLVAKALNVPETDLGSNRFHVAAPDLDGQCITSLGVAAHAHLLVASGHFTEHYILQKCEAESVEALELETYAAWCGSKKIKTRIAVALADALDEASARSLGPLVAVVEDAVEAIDDG